MAVLEICFSRKQGAATTARELCRHPAASDDLSIVVTKKCEGEVTCKPSPQVPKGCQVHST